MKTAKTSDIIGIINKIAPVSLAEEWDNPGLQVGDPCAEVKSIMVALDPTSEVIDSAIASSCQLLLTHHPLIFKPLKSISTATRHGNNVHKAIKAGLSIVCMHTNYDIAEGGLNDLLSRKLGLDGCVPLQVTATEELFKLVVFVPVDNVEHLKSALFPYIESIGNYRDCSFTAEGTGTFTPLEGATPYTGKVGTHQKVSEQRLELLLGRKNLPKAIKALMSAHRYEEPAFDVYPLLNDGKKLGLGRIGHLAAPLSLDVFAGQIREKLSALTLRYVGDPSKIVSKVAICSGSGSSLLREAARAGADVLVTGDVKYHEAREAEELDLAMIDAGHFPTEIIMVEDMVERVGNALRLAGHNDCPVIPCLVETDPFRF